MPSSHLISPQQRADDTASLGRSNRAGGPLGELRALATEQGAQRTRKGRVAGAGAAGLTVYPIAVKAATTRPTTFGHTPVSGITPLAMARPTNVAPAVIHPASGNHPG